MSSSGRLYELERSGVLSREHDKHIGIGGFQWCWRVIPHSLLGSNYLEIECVKDGVSWSCEARATISIEDPAECESRRIKRFQQEFLFNPKFPKRQWAIQPRNIKAMKIKIDILKSSFVEDVRRFSSRFADGKLDEIPIEEVDYDQFVHLLNCVYPGTKTVCASNVDYLVPLSERFDLPVVREECGKFFSRAYIDIKKHLRQMDRHGFYSIIDEHVAHISDVAELQAMLDSNEEYLRQDTIQIFTNRIYQLARNCKPKAAAAHVKR